MLDLDTSGELEDASLLENCHRDVHLRFRPRGLVVGSGSGAAEERVAWAPALPPEQLGSSEFRRAHGVRYAYAAGEMAHAISSTRMVIELARSGLLGIYGAAGVPPVEIERALGAIADAVGPNAPFGSNLVHDIHDPAAEDAVVGIYERRNIRCMSVSAFMSLTKAMVRYRMRGVYTTPEGNVVVPNRLMAKISRATVARVFLEPPPPAVVAELVYERAISAREADLASRITMADDIVCEGDSGGHTDRQPLFALFPEIRALRSRIAARHPTAALTRLGVAGGIGTPSAVAAAFAMGADFVVSGSINQSCREAGTSDVVRRMLADADASSFAMAAAADMFELGVQVQVLKHGTMFAARSRRLWTIYQQRRSLDELTPEERLFLEATCFRRSIDEVWSETAGYFRASSPAELEHAEHDPHHRLALLLRWYLGMSSRWARGGDPERRSDFQVWCGPAMGAFNAWVKGSFLENLEQRSVVQVAENLMHGAAVLTRLSWLQLQGANFPPSMRDYRPRPFSQSGSSK